MGNRTEEQPETPDASAVFYAGPLNNLIANRLRIGETVPTTGSLKDTGVTAKGLQFLRESRGPEHNLFIDPIDAVRVLGQETTRALVDGGFLLPDRDEEKDRPAYRFNQGSR